MGSIRTEWDDDDHTIMRVTYQPGWTWDDMEDNFQIEAEYLDSVTHKVAVIADFRGTRLPPGAVSRLPIIAQSPPYTHPNAGAMVMVSSQDFMNEVVKIYKRVYGQAAKLVVAEDLPTARALIAARRTSTGT